VSGDYGFDRVEEAASAVAGRCGRADAAIVLGSGLGGVAQALSEPVEMPYAAIPNWPAPGVAGHSGRLSVGTLSGRRVAVLSGRVHAYEGVPLPAVVFAARVMARLGVSTFVCTNAAGGIAPTLAPGTIMVIDDHLNLLGASPLTGPNDERFGPRFPDMSEAYSRRLRAVADEAALARGVKLAHGVYACVPGPSYETPAEIRYLRAIGADAVGMSTVPEVIAARHLGVDVLGLSCITNMAAGLLPQPLSHDEVLETARGVGRAMSALLEGVVERL